MFPGQEPFVSIITLNYNQAAVTCAMLESAMALDYSNYEILVCDMASAEDPSIIADRSYPRTRLLRSPQNLGFAAGNNWGMDQAGGDYFFIVNNDTIFTPGLLKELLQPFFTLDKVGASSPKILFYEQPVVIQFAGFAEMNRYTGRTHTIGEKETDHGQYNTAGTTAAVHGCAMMIPKKVAQQSGRFPATFFLYYEEWDWSLRIRDAGYQLRYVPSASILHKESVTVGKANPLKLYYHTRNRLLLMRRNNNFTQLSVFFHYFIFAAVPAGTLRFLLKGDARLLPHFFRGIAHGLSMSSRSAT